LPRRLAVSKLSEMSVSAHFSAPTAAGLVLGGIAAILLATVMAFRSSQRHVHANASVKQAASVNRTIPLPAATFGGAPPEAEVEYLLDTSGSPNR
jgi:hypothetical protein